MARQIQRVEQVIRYVLQPGNILFTPGRGDPPDNQVEFYVTGLDADGIRVSKVAGQLVAWRALEGVIPYLQARNGAVRIGATNNIAAPGTLESYLRNESGSATRTANYVAPILAAAGVVEYIQEGQAKHIRLIPPYMENPP
ncbi:MAG: hypothetical protein OXU28_17960 [Chloroflexota bacterium]|nr:hypothetical protein [Chloroflexota bacterium]